MSAFHQTRGAFVVVGLESRFDSCVAVCPRVLRSAPKMGVPRRLETPTIENASPIRRLCQPRVCEWPSYIWRYHHHSRRCRGFTSHQTIRGYPGQYQKPMRQVDGLGLITYDVG